MCIYCNIHIYIYIYIYIHIYIYTCIHYYKTAIVWNAFLAVVNCCFVSNNRFTFEEESVQPHPQLSTWAGQTVNAVVLGMTITIHY